MLTLKDLTPEIRSKIPEYKSRVNNFNFPTFSHDKQASIEYIEKLYEIAGQKKPTIIFAKNPDEFSSIYQSLHKKSSKKFYKKKNLLTFSNPIFIEIQKEIYSKCLSLFEYRLYINLEFELRHELNLKLSIYKSDFFINAPTSLWELLTTVYARCALSLYMFAYRELNVQYDENNTLSYLYERINKTSIGICHCTQSFVLVQTLPKCTYLNSKLHNENDAAIKFDGGYKSYYWKGVKVPKKLIMYPEKITKEDIREQNHYIEVRRAFIEKLGITKYFEILSDKESLSIVDEDVDQYGYPIRLFSLNFENITVQILECTCPSTQRVYNIYPPSQNCKNVWDAKADLFNHKKITYRHGDVGLQRTGYNSDKPLIET